MDPDAEPDTMIIKLIILIVLLAMSAFFSSAETAFISADKFAIRQLIQDGKKRAKLVAKILEDKDAMISAILIGNNIVNI
jgi:Mg2+/Co2+ transporter CorB